MCNFLAALYHWQTLAAGFLAVAVGGVTIFFIRRQITQNENFRRDDMQRRHRAIKAGLPLALDEIQAYARLCFNFSTHVKRVSEMDPSFSRMMLGRERFDIVPRFPYQAFERVRLSIETASESEAAKLAQLISFGQVHLARFEDHVADIRNDDSDDLLSVEDERVKDRMLDSAVLYAATAWLFPYARGAVSSIQDLPKLNSIGLLISDLDKAYESDVIGHFSKLWGAGISEFDVHKSA